MRVINNSGLIPIKVEELEKVLKNSSFVQVSSGKARDNDYVLSAATYAAAYVNWDIIEKVIMVCICGDETQLEDICIASGYIQSCANKDCEIIISVNLNSDYYNAAKIILINISYSEFGDSDK